MSYHLQLDAFSRYILDTILIKIHLSRYHFSNEIWLLRNFENRVIGFYHNMVPLEVRTKFPRHYHDFLDESLNLLVPGLDAFEHLTHEIDRFLIFVFLLDEHITHHLVIN